MTNNAHTQDTTNVGAQRAVPRDSTSGHESPAGHRRRSVRVGGFDYRSSGAYFVTLVTHRRKPLFGKIDGELVALSTLGLIAREEWLNTAVLRPYVELDEFVVMPNHMHGILWIKEGGAFHGRGTARCAPTEHEPPVREFGRMVPCSLPAIVRAFKAATTRRVNLLRGTPGTPAWQRNYHERVIRNDRELQDIRQYILDNPAKWAYDREWIANEAIA